MSELECIDWVSARKVEDDALLALQQSTIPAVGRAELHDVPHGAGRVAAQQRRCAGHHAAHTVPHQHDLASGVGLQACE